MNRSNKGLKDMVASSRRLQKSETYNFLNANPSSTATISRSSVGLREQGSMIDDLLARIESLKFEIEQKNATLQTIQKNLEAVSLLCKAEKTENTELKRKLEGTSKQNSEMQVALKNANFRISDLLERLVKFENDPEKDRLLRINGNIKEEINQIRRRNEEIERLMQEKQEELAEALAKLDQLETAKNTSGDLFAQIKNLRMKIGELEEEIEKQKYDESAKKEEIETLKGSLRKERDEAEGLRYKTRVTFITGGFYEEINRKWKEK
jgi:chromosome segregation ATPase